MHASRLFKCFFFFFLLFFSSDGIEKFRPWKNSYRSAMSFQFFQHSEISGLRGTRYTRASCDKWLFFPSHWFFFFFFLWNVSGKIQLFCTSNLIPGFDLSMRELSRGVDVDASTLFCIVIYSFNFIYSWKLLTKLWIKWFFLFRAIGRGRISLMIRFNNRI